MRLSLQALEARDNPSALSPQVPVELWQNLAADVRILAQATTTPSQESVQNLVTVVQSAIADGQITPREQVQIAAAANAVLTSANIPISEIQAVVYDLQAIYQARQI